MANDSGIAYVPPSVEKAYYATFSADDVLAIALEVHEYSIEIGDAAGIEAAEKIFAIGEAKLSVKV